jgi:uncharacterized protein (TIGR02145 family)
MIQFKPHSRLSIVTLLLLAACSSKMSDIEGNTYRTVRIGEQTWMAENLRTTQYRDGSSIPQVPDGAQWAALRSGAWASYDNNASYIATDGLLYNGFAVTDQRGLCPEGWRLPSDGDWTALATHLGGDAEAGGKLKSTGIDRWTKPNAGATDESGFGGHPSGYRYKNGQFDHLGSGGYWWSSTAPTDSTLGYRALHYDYADVMGNISPITTGYAVRCVME